MWSWEKKMNKNPAVFLMAESFFFCSLFTLLLTSSMPSYKFHMVQFRSGDFLQRNLVFSFWLVFNFFDKSWPKCYQFFIGQKWHHCQTSRRLLLIQKSIPLYSSSRHLIRNSITILHCLEIGTLNVHPIKKANFVHAHLHTFQIRTMAQI